jgi:hypothetical protein
MSKTDKQQFEDLSQAPQPGLVAEFIDFLKHNKKWWLLPILIVIGLVGALAAFSATGAGPFIYTFW